MVGVGLSAAAVFVYLFPLALARDKAGHVTFGQEFVWMDSNVALAAFGLAALLEVGAYYIPWLDNALDTVAAPAAVVAGTLTSASVFGQDMSPWLKWSLAAIAGGGAAGAVQLTTTVTRGTSSASRWLGQLDGVHWRRRWSRDHGHSGDCGARAGVYRHAYAGRVHHLPQSAQTLPRVASSQFSDEPVSEPPVMAT